MKYTKRKEETIETKEVGRIHKIERKEIRNSDGNRKTTYLKNIFYEYNSRHHQQS